MRELPSVLLSLLLLAFIGCENKKNVPHPVGCNAASSIEGTWRLDAFQNLNDGTREPDPNPKGRGVVLTFKEDSTSIGFQGHTAANAVGGRYRKAGSCDLENGSFGGSKVGEPTKWDGKVWTAMANAEAYGLTKKNLFLYFNAKSEVMIFSKVR